MNRFVAVLAIALGVVPMLNAADVETKEITFKSGEDEVKGFLAVPKGKGPFPGVIVIQEWWGLNDWVKDNAKRIAEQGYVALAPDLYRGKVATKPEEARELSTGLPRDQALRDIKGAVDALAKMENVNKTKLGVIGWCMGGGFALAAATEDDRLTACVICYGRVVTEADKLKPLKATVLGIFAEDDRGIPPKQVREFEDALKEAGKKTEKIHIFKGVGHGFMRTTKGEQTREAWEAIDTFFARTLKDK
jgi:carboxymethylenebutenolidase